MRGAVLAASFGGAMEVEVTQQGSRIVVRRDYKRQERNVGFNDSVYNGWPRRARILAMPALMMSWTGI